MLGSCLSSPRSPVGVSPRVSSELPSGRTAQIGEAPAQRKRGAVPSGSWLQLGASTRYSLWAAGKGTALGPAGGRAGTQGQELGERTTRGSDRAVPASGTKAVAKGYREQRHVSPPRLQ